MTENNTPDQAETWADFDIPDPVHADTVHHCRLPITGHAAHAFLIQYFGKSAAAESGREGVKVLSTAATTILLSAEGQIGWANFIGVQPGEELDHNAMFAGVQAMQGELFRRTQADMLQLVIDGLGYPADEDVSQDPEAGVSALPGEEL